MAIADAVTPLNPIQDMRPPEFRLVDENAMCRIGTGIQDISL